VELVFRALGDPFCKDLLLLRSELLVRRHRGHHQRQILLVDSLNQPTGRSVARLEHSSRHGDLAPVQTQTGLSGIAVGTVACETVLRKNRPHIAIELDALGGRTDRTGK